MCRQVLESQPDDAEALNNLAWVLAMRDQVQVCEALALINRALELNDADPSLVDTRAVILIRSGQNDRALEQLRSVYQQNPHDPGVAFHMAWAYRASVDLDSARAKLQEAKAPGSCSPNSGSSGTRRGPEIAQVARCATEHTRRREFGPVTVRDRSLSSKSARCEHATMH